MDFNLEALLELAGTHVEVETCVRPPSDPNRCCPAPNSPWLSPETLTPCLNACVHTCIYMHAYIHYTYVHIPIHIHIHAVYVYVCVCMYICIYVCMYVCKNVKMYVRPQALKTGSQEDDAQAACRAKGARRPLDPAGRGLGVGSPELKGGF